MELQYLANLAEIFGALVVLGGLTFAAVQILQFQEQRREAAAIQVINSFQDPEFTRCFKLVLTMPDGISLAQVKQIGPDAEYAAFQVGFTIETVGLMVYRRLVPLQIVHELMGGIIRLAWKKLGVYMQELRTEQGQDSLAEWMQWLTERELEYKARNPTPPAHIAYTKWKP